MRLFIILATCSAAVYGVLPPNIFNPKCPRFGPQTAPCIKKGIEKFRPYMRNGIPDINIPRFEPFKMRELDLDVDVEALTIKGEATNIVAYGASNFQLKDLKINMKDFTMELELYIPRLDVTADFDSSGTRLMGSETSGSGQFKGVFYGVIAIVKTNGHSVTKKGQEHAKVDETTIDLKFGKSEIRVDPDAKNPVSKTVSNFINASPMMVMKSLDNVINMAAAPVVQRYLSKVLNVVPLSDIFL